MAEARFPIAPGETVTAFELGPLEERYFPGEVAAGHDAVDYRFVNGFVDVGDLPCRVATWAEVKARETPELVAFDAVAVALPGFSRRLDFSGFWHRPHRLARWCRTRLVPEAAGAARFRLATCGGVNVWVDGRHVAAFEPFTRNAVQETELVLPLTEGGSELVLLVEEMAERDTNFFVELTWEGPGALVAALPTGADPGALEVLRGLARDMRPARLCFGAGEALELAFDAPAPTDVAIRAEIRPSVHLSHKPALFAAEAVLRAGETRVVLGAAAHLEDGYHPLDLTLEIGAARVERQIAFARLGQKAAREIGSDLAARKAAALDRAARQGEPRIGRLLAMLALGRPFDAVAREILDDTLDGIEGRRDCSDFIIVPLLWCLAEHGAAFPPEAAARAREAVLGYRYWVDEPGNDTMWFWSENHVLCFHVAEYLAGRLYPDAVFPNAGMTGAGHAALARGRLERWLASVKAHGLAEWNSAAYYPIDFIGLFALHRFGEADLRDRAREILDRLFTMIALHSIGGVAAGTMGRAYDKELRAGPLTELAPFAAVAFGPGWLNGGVAALPQFCACDYAPPEGLDALAAPPAGQAVQARYVQGYGTQARLALWKTAHMQLSASVDAAPGQGGHQQHLVDVQAEAAPFARVWINHPGEDDPWGSNRPSYWAGNGVMPRVGMDGNCALVLSDLGAAPRLAFTHAYAPAAAFDSVLSGADWLVLASGGGAVTLKASGPIRPVTRGPGAGIEWRCEGARTGWAVLVDDLPEGGLLALAARAEGMVLALGPGPSLRLEGAGGPELRLDHVLGLFRDDRAVPFPTGSRVPVIERLPRADF